MIVTKISGTEVIVRRIRVSELVKRDLIGRSHRLEQTTNVVPSGCK